MSTSEHYDVVVIGRTVGGLITAALLAKRRLRVRVLNGPNESALATPLFGLETTPSLYGVMDELGLVHDITLAYMVRQSPLQLLSRTDALTFRPLRRNAQPFWQKLFEFDGCSTDAFWHG